MADIKVLYIDSNGYRAEHSESGDSVKFQSFKTANYELTDTKLGHLVDGNDAANEHIHDGRYFRENEHIASSAGAGDAGKPIITDAGGKIDESLIDTAALGALIDHGDLVGLGDDDHTIYTKADGTRAFTGIVSYSTHPTFSSNTQIVDKKYVDDQIDTVVNGIEWQDSVLDRAIVPPGSPSTGDRYLIDASLGSATSAWATHDDKIAEWDGSAWVFTSPTTGMAVSVDDETTVLYFYTGAAWDSKQFEATTASTGLVKVGNDIRIDASAAGAGLGFSSGVLSINVDDSSIEINTDTLQVKADGIKDTMIDWGTGAGQVSAADVPIADAGGYTSATDVEAALQDIFGQLGANGVEYTVGVGGVTKGYPLYISADDTAIAYASLAGSQRVVGLAATTESAASTVKSVSKDTVLTSAISGFTAGQTVYWTGSGFSASIPSGTGSHVWKLGVAKNATDLHVDLEFIKRNA